MTLCVFVKQPMLFCIAYGCDACGSLSHKGGQFVSHFAMRYCLVRTLGFHTRDFACRTEVLGGKSSRNLYIHSTV